MIFKDYCNQPLDQITRRHGVKVFDDDIEQAYHQGVPYYWTVNIDINGKIFQYVLKNDSDALWVQDQDGNPERRSCFVYSGTKLRSNV